MLERGQNPAWLNDGAEIWYQVCLSGAWKKGRIQPGSAQGLRCGLRRICRGFEQGQDPAHFNAASAMRALWCFPG